MVAKETFVFKAEIVEEVNAKLAAMSGRTGINSSFSGYLAALSAVDGTVGGRVKVTDLTPFFDLYLQPKNHTDNWPWYVPWARSVRAPEWLNRNAAGSYSVGTAKARNAFGRVMEPVEEPGFQGWGLPKDHHVRALRELLSGKAVPAAYVASFLLRDFGFERSEANHEGAIRALRYAIGLDGPEHEKVYVTLFSDSPRIKDDWYEIWRT